MSSMCLNILTKYILLVCCKKHMASHPIRLASLALVWVLHLQVCVPLWNS